jgi:putative ABC transport system ATP-binding protein
MLEVRGLAKAYGRERLFEAVDLDVAPAEWVAIVGESGSGKSTLLNVIAGIDRPGSGTVALEGTAIDYADDDALARWRRANVGFVFQAFHLLPYLDVGDNVALPLALLGTGRRERLARAHAALESVGLAGFGDRRPASLSGGEAQRAAIARAVVHRPRLILADEPTGNLDEATAAKVLDTLAKVVRETRAAALMVTHSTLAAGRADRVMRLANGRLRAAGP